MLSQQELSTLARKATRAARRLAVACDRATYGPISTVPGRREALDALKAARRAMEFAIQEITTLNDACEKAGQPLAEWLNQANRIARLHLVMASTQVKIGERDLTPWDLVDWADQPSEKELSDLADYFTELKADFWDGFEGDRGTFLRHAIDAILGTDWAALPDDGQERARPSGELRFVEELTDVMAKAQEAPR